MILRLSLKKTDLSQRTRRYMKRIKYLYRIKDPVTNEVKYVGQTFHPRQRYREHLRGKLEVEDWMRAVVKEGRHPEMFIIDRKRMNVNRRERELITLARKQNASLLNRLIPRR
jgi:hypothetical protein